MKRKLAFILIICAFAVPLYLLACERIGVELAERTLHPWRKPLQYQAQVAREIERLHGKLQNVSIHANDGAELKAWFVEPSTPNGRSVILYHGVSDNREGVAGYARLFLQHGYRVLLPDSRAHGESGGEIATYGVLEADDIRRWVDWLQGTSARCVYGFGESMGAALIVQSLRAEDRFCAVIAESSFATFREVAYDRFELQLPLGGLLARIILRPAVNTALEHGRTRYGLDLENADPLSAVRKTRVPVLLIHGQEDEVISPRHSRTLHAANPQAVTLWEVGNAGHGGGWTVDPTQFESRVLEWLTTHQR